MFNPKTLSCVLNSSQSVGKYSLLYILAQSWLDFDDHDIGGQTAAQNPAWSHRSGPKGDGDSGSLRGGGDRRWDGNSTQPPRNPAALTEHSMDALSVASCSQRARLGSKEDQVASTSTRTARLIRRAKCNRWPDIVL